MLYIEDEKSADKVKDILISISDVNKKQKEAINVAIDLIDELVMEGRW